ncbi:MAG: sensor domain-containing diguanylate cyclase [Deltaproteobacteria bacterium]|nr:sensor domain-containing diguanylate cyclase [Deltaproteobacteria bacterium]
MPSIAIPEEQLRLFLGRKRRGRTVIEPPPLAAWLAQTLDLARTLVPSQAGSLLLDEPGRRGATSPLTFVAAFGPASERLIGMNVPAGRGIVGHVYREGVTWVTADPGDDPHFFGSVDQSASFQTRSVVAAPIRLESKVCGVFELVNRKGRARFSERDRLTVELFAQHVSRAILNAVDILKQNQLALRDDLTGLYNTRSLERYLGSELTRQARTADADLSVLFLDVDRLKAVNDRLGHGAGSELLRRVGRAVDHSLRALALTDARAYRFGGDEFVVILPSQRLERAEELAEAVRAAVSEINERPMRHGGRLPKVTLSVGVASARCSLRHASSHASRGARILAAADKALYRAKRRGRDRVVRATRRDDTLGR